ncbi:glycoside hydrolase family 99-like domain-containing protein [Negadavirga shengliensis]|uniref:Glycoside hydrolase family 99-like domain-containing protein n=1 Tax=Negadavirga shengliensis TaxID=1389218 RepID=A0ABV9T1K8_9BACT
MRRGFNTFLFFMSACAAFLSCAGFSHILTQSGTDKERMEKDAGGKGNSSGDEETGDRVTSSQLRKVGETEKVQVGVYFMPSWNTSADRKIDRDSFWECLKGRENCSYLYDQASWGPKGRIYSRQYPYEGPFLDKKPIPELKGFYRRDDPEVAKKQLEYMKAYGIDFFAYNWFFGRHYYYHMHFAPQARLFYPEGWPVDSKRDGRVKVPGLEEWDGQLKVLLAENEKLPADRQMKFAINWCDDSESRWTQWLAMASPGNIKTRINYPGENPDKNLYLQVHDKITLTWIHQYFKRKDYLKDERGRPIVYFYFPHDTEARASYYGISLGDLLKRSQDLAKKEGFPGIKFIAVTSGAMTERLRPYAMPTTWRPNDPNKPWAGGTYGNRMLFQDYVPRLKKMGFEGMTGYLYHNFYDQENRSYQDMRKTYRGHWQKWSEYYKNDPGFEYQVPVAMGWDRRPAGGTWPQQTGVPSEPQKDRVISNKATFKAKLEEARKVILSHKENNGNTLMVCCWNEYLEGNHIEPTEGHGFGYLEAIREVFMP